MRPLGAGETSVAWLWAQEELCSIVLIWQLVPASCAAGAAAPGSCWAPQAGAAALCGALRVSWAPAYRRTSFGIPWAPNLPTSWGPGNALEPETLWMTAKTHLTGKKPSALKCGCRIQQIPAVPQHWLQSTTILSCLGILSSLPCLARQQDSSEHLSISNSLGSKNLRVRVFMGSSTTSRWVLKVAGVSPALLLLVNMGCENTKIREGRESLTNYFYSC